MSPSKFPDCLQDLETVVQHLLSSTGDRGHVKALKSKKAARAYQLGNHSTGSFGQVDNLRHPPRLPAPAPSSCRNFNIAHLNARSVTNKTLKINMTCYVSQRHGNNSWLYPFKHADPPPWLLLPRSVGEGGRVAAVYCSDLTVKELRPFEVTSFEYIALKVVSIVPLLLLLIYRPPQTTCTFLLWIEWAPYCYFFSLLCCNYARGL